MPENEIKKEIKGGGEGRKENSNSKLKEWLLSIIFLNKWSK